MSPSTLLYPPQPVPPASIDKLIATSSVCASIGPRLAPYLEHVVLPAKTVVVREGEVGREMYFLVEGEAHLRRANVDLGRIGPGAHFGELALIAGRLRTSSVVATEALTLARLSREQYERMSKEDPELALCLTHALVVSLGEELTEMTENVGALLHERSLPRRVFLDVTVNRAWMRVRTGTALGELLPRDVDGDPVVAALVNNKAVSLAMPITSDAHVEPLCASHWEGKRVYRASLGLLLLAASRRVDPDVFVRLGPGAGFGQPIELLRPGALSLVSWAERVTGMMRELIAEDAPFQQELWTVDEARSHFAEGGARDLLALLRTWRTGHVQLVCAGGEAVLSMTPMLPSAGHLPPFPFRIEVDGAAVMLRYGDESRVAPEGGAAPSSSRLPEDIQPSSARLGVRQDEPWLTTLGITSVGAFNEACVRGKTPEIIRVSEGQHEKRISRIADAIAGRGTVRVICVAGPSSSGKTTFLSRLTVQLLVNGIHPVGLSLDDYYVDREKTVRDARGEYDYEALEAIDLGALRGHLARIFAGEAVKTARYDFLTGKSHPEGGREVTLRSSDVLLIEGIHGLNPRLLDGILPRDKVFRIFIQPMTALPFDRVNRINVSDVRLLRRIVRDRHGRGTNAAANIQRWPSVRAGERSNIFPFLAQADAIFDSSLVYELGVIKVFADRYLLEVPQEHPAFVTAYRLRQLIDKVVTIYPDHVPPTSILREFIGGSGFEY
ncbi:cyclic nucleotide-binding domain-containing protein [Polyangium spumosum]|uniref:Cyclic nucleotide-binding domain-containing protein n=1 Tax=Polyangium spumosum TaxID=889282 RepID=A0A6N7PS60_9BACT|nr:cyclic nucleotide-binding domain-containing protein [Polyangium spumosum]MRG94769.1 cyclic nucleotide-binding domain-containing protein [Polyangium spumosum]